MWSNINVILWILQTGWYEDYVAVTRKSDEVTTHRLDPKKKNANKKQKRWSKNKKRNRLKQ